MNNNSVYEEDYKGYHISIEMDDDCGNESPRNWDNLGTMACWHSRYTLGDEQPKDDPIEYMRHKLYDYWKAIEQITTYEVWAEFQEREDENNDTDVDSYIGALNDTGVQDYFNRFYISLPIFMYDHSGITIRTSSFSCPWDSGQLGFIFVSKKDAMKNWNEKHEWSKELEDKTIKLLEAEVKTYDDYLTGSVYGYRVFKLDNEEDYDKDDCLDSCWGFYPEHNPGEQDYAGCLREARDIVDYHAKKDAEEEAQIIARINGQAV